jgi:hypothetical protein
MLLVLMVLFLGGVAMCVYHSPKETILSINLIGGKIEIIKTQDGANIQSMYAATNNLAIFGGDSILLPAPISFNNRRVWKEIYIAKNGVIVLEKIIEGKIIPAQEERIEFSE